MSGPDPTLLSTEKKLTSVDARGVLQVAQESRVQEDILGSVERIEHLLFVSVGIVVLYAAYIYMRAYMTYNSAGVGHMVNVIDSVKGGRFPYSGMDVALAMESGWYRDFKFGADLAKVPETITLVFINNTSPDLRGIMLHKGVEGVLYDIYIQVQNHPQKGTWDIVCDCAAFDKVVTECKKMNKKLCKPSTMNDVTTGVGIGMAVGMLLAPFTGGISVAIAPLCGLAGAAIGGYANSTKKVPC